MNDSVKHRPVALGLTSLVAVMVIAGCSIGVQSYEEFRSAVESGATCSQLWDIEQNFEDTADEKRVRSDLAEIGCDTAQAARTDRQDD